MAADRLKWVRIEGFRSIADLTIDIDELQVLIGENGSGKTTIIEAFEILSMLLNEQRFTIEFAARHGAIHDIIRRGSSCLRLSLRIENSSTDQSSEESVPIEYAVELTPTANSPYPAISKESLEAGDILTMFSRTDSAARVWQRRTRTEDEKSVRVPSEVSMMNYWGADAPAEVRRLRAMIAGFRVHVAFETKPAWAHANGREAPPSLRDLAQMEEADRLIRGGMNLVSIFHQLNTEGPALRQAVLEDIQLGLGLDVEDFSTPLRGRFATLSLKIRGVGLVPASQLSEGQLAFLGLVALRHFNDTSATLMLFDEPELHLHPALVVRAAALFLALSKQVPAIVATHAEALLEHVDPVENVRVLGLVGRKTVMRRLSPDKMQQWQKLYASVGEARREGRLEDLLADVAPS